jgi:CRISPR/Cas system-associated exonuclease Cas4 (RecB family)
MFNRIIHNIPILERVEVDGVRYYKAPNQSLYPSVTTVLSDYNEEALKDWKERVGEKEATRVSNVAKTRGSSVHKLIERYLGNEQFSQKEIMSFVPNVKQPFVNIRKELDKFGDVHCIEDHLYSDNLKLAGTVDCIAEYKGILSVIDFKTSRRLKKKEDIRSYFLQATAYAVMFTERTGIEIEDLIIIIGVDGVNFAQVMKEKVANFYDELQDRVIDYRNRHGLN